MLGRKAIKTQTGVNVLRFRSRGESKEMTSYPLILFRLSHQYPYWLSEGILGTRITGSVKSTKCIRYYLNRLNDGRN